MQIPFGSNSGQSVPNSPGPVSVPRGAFDTSSGITNLGQQAMQINEGNQRFELEQQQVQQRAQAAVTLAQTTNDMYAAHDEVAQGVASGTISPDQAHAELAQRVAKIKETNLADLSPFQRQIVDDNVLHAQGGMERSLNGVIIKRNQSDTAATIDQCGEQAQRDATRIGPAAASDKYDALIDFAGPAAGMTPAKQEQAKQKFKETVHLGFYDQAGVTALANKDLTGVTAVLQKVQGPDGDVLDPVQRSVLTHKLFGYQQHLEAQNRIAQNQELQQNQLREKIAGEVFEKMQDLTMNGQYMDPDSITRLVTATDGTAWEKDGLALVASQSQIAGFASLPAAQRTAVLERAKSAGADPTVGTNPHAAKILSIMERIDSTAATAAKDNPWSAAQKYGVIKDAPVMDATNPASALAVIKQRMTQIPLVENWTGQKISPLQPVESEALTKAIKSLPIDQQASALGEIGKMVGDPERIAMVSKQINDKDGNMGLAMAYTNAQTTEGRTTAELILKGAQALRDKTVKIDGMAESGWRATIAKTIRGAFSDQAMEDKYVDSAFLIAAANGGSDIDRAVRLATGGIIDFNGSKVPMPYGMTADGQSSGEKKFKAAISAITPADITAQAPDGMVVLGNTKMPVDQFVKTLPDARLVHAGQGQYNVRAGNGLVTNAAGQRITLKVHP